MFMVFAVGSWSIIGSCYGVIYFLLFRDCVSVVISYE